MWRIQSPRLNTAPGPSRRMQATGRLCMFWSLFLMFSCLCLLQYAHLGRTHGLDPQHPSHAELSLRISDILLNSSRVQNLVSGINVSFKSDETVPLGFMWLTAILPITYESFVSFDVKLGTLLNSSKYLAEVILVSPPALQSQAENSFLSVLESGGNSAHVKLKIFTWPSGYEEDRVSLRAAQQARTPFVLLLDDCGLENIDAGVREVLTLLEPFSTTLPIGPYGFIRANDSQDSVTCVSSSHIPQPASFLIPPLVMPLSLVPALDLNCDASYGVWSALGTYIAQSETDSEIGGFVIGSDETSPSWCRPDEQLGFPVSTYRFQEEYPISLDASLEDVTPTNETCDARIDLLPVVGAFVLILSSFAELRELSPAACRLQKVGHAVHVLIDGEGGETGLWTSTEDQDAVADACRLSYDLIEMHSNAALSTITDWFYCHSDLPDVVITTLEKNVLSATTFSHMRFDSQWIPTVINIPGTDLSFCDWIGSLTLQEFKNWHVPHLDISVITNDRPHSLARLLASLSTASYFGDSLDLRINMEQTTDRETLQVVDALKWDRGRVFLHRRVIHGGLLPAVVESWYPNSDDSYGLILEDDVELSPLFYAWIKLALLRYRYGRYEDRSPQLFGISLYQQKHLELRPEGRHPFNARNAFSAIGLMHSHTPYLSQIPCSWGAVYFPEHWREFHDYLSFRLSEYAWDADQIVVSDVRSNKWTRSWKKYFIELVYLRGYLMLYPNYADYVSLSTNHLEVGSHVKDVPIETYLRKKKLFSLPLMKLPAASQSPPSTGLLDLPDATLPAWSLLPSLDLLGLLAREEELLERGQSRRVELTGCQYEPSTRYDVWDLLCLHDHPFGL